MFSEEKCPSCGYEDYTIDDYKEDFEDGEAAQWWNCTCPKCNTKFTICRAYTLNSVKVVSVS